MSYSANQTRIFVVYGPPGEKHQSVLQITIRFGKNPTEREHILRQRFLQALQSYKEYLDG
jgi:hypothetical protein